MSLHSRQGSSMPRPRCRGLDAEGLDALCGQVAGDKQALTPARDD